MSERDREAIIDRCTRFVPSWAASNLEPAETFRALADRAGTRGDVYGGGESVERLESRVAELLGKEAAVVFPSGTMAQQVALRMWCERKGRSTVAFHPQCHLEVHEERGYERLHRLHARLVGDRNRLIALEDLDGDRGAARRAPARASAAQPRRSASCVGRSRGADGVGARA